MHARGNVASDNPNDAVVEVVAPQGAAAAAGILAAALDAAREFDA